LAKWLKRQENLVKEEIITLGSSHHSLPWGAKEETRVTET
jgi:hypothetical protein